MYTFAQKWEKVVTHGNSKGNRPVSHIPVLSGEVAAWLACKSDGIYLDCTVGQGGHTEVILERSGPDGVVIGIDRDREAIAATGSRLDRKSVV